MPKTGHFILHSNVIPKLTAGRYDLVTDQTGLPFDVAEEHTHITVASPRYVMPTDQILSTFPPANAEGAFGDRLPQIVLKRRTLPWERNAEEVVEPPLETPWLALVVVAEGEAQLSTATPVADCVTPGTKLLDPQDKDVEQGLYLAVTQTVLKKIFPCKDDLALCVHVREVDVNDTELANGDDDGWLAVVLANRLPVFDTANGKSVRYMACLVSVEGQLDALPPPEPPDNHFSWELAQDWTVLAGIDPTIGPDPIVMGGFDPGNIQIPGGGGVFATPPEGMLAAIKPPAQGSGRGATVGASLDGAKTMRSQPVAQQWKSVTDQVNAVALDPDAKRLVRDTMASGFRLPIELFAVEKVFRFPVLAHWSFTTNEGATFETLMQDLDVGLVGTLPSPPADVPETADRPEVIETGHIGLDHRSRRGDAVRAWYRGPLVPFPVDREKPGDDPQLAHSADQLRRVVPDGREDLSLAAAFEIGRLLALSQLSVVSALLRFRNEQFGAGRVRELLSQLTAYDIPLLVDSQIDMGRFVAVQVVNDLVKNPAHTIGPRRPVADPGRELFVSGDLDEVIADGLGMNLDTIRQVSDEIGVVAALSRASVPVGEALADIAPLRDALQHELANVLNVAAPQQMLKTPGRGKARAVAPSDALDAVLERAAAAGRSDEGGE